MKDMPLDSADLTWLAGLASALIRERHAADDLAQDTVVAALEGKLPPEPRRRAWLSSVAQRLAARRFRGEARRARREQQAAQPEALPDSAELLERAELAEQVAAATRSLPEPFRRTIFLRFLEGLSPSEIARREGKPADTVRLRVRRGLELLRQELARRNGRDWSATSVLLLPLARVRGSTGTAAAGASGALVSSVAPWILMNLKTVTFVLGSAVLCAGGFFIVQGVSSDAPGDDLLVDAGTRPQAADDTGERAPSVPSTARIERAAVPEASSSKATEVARPSIFGRVVDVGGVAVAGATVYLVPPGKGRTPGGRPVILAETETDPTGAFRIPKGEWGIADPDLGILANGFLRKLVPHALRSQPRAGWLLRLDRGRTLRGRVVDADGRGVGGLRLLVHTARAGVGHVSPSQVLLRARRAALADSSSGYEQSRGRTDSRGMIELTGLPAGDLTVRSVDPGWTIQEPGTVEADGTYVVWKTARRLGVRLVVVDAKSRKPVPVASAVFCVRITFADGEAEDFQQWVGRGRGGVSFALDSGILPQLAKRKVKRAEFYGTVRSGEGAKKKWRAKPIENATKATGVAEVRVAVDAVPAPETPRTAAPEANLVLDVRYADGVPFAGAIAVRWSSRPEQGPKRQGRVGSGPLANGRFRFPVVAGRVDLRVSDRTASGSLEAWTGTVRCAPNRDAIAFVKLPRGAAVRIARPDGWTGQWYVHASWRERSGDRWFGSWNYGTKEPTLKLSALRPAEWRFQLRQDSERAPNPLVRNVRLFAGDDVVVR